MLEEAYESVLQDAEAWKACHNPDSQEAVAHLANRADAEVAV